MMVMIVIEKIIQFLKHVQILNVYCEEKKKNPTVPKDIFAISFFSRDRELSLSLENL